MAKRLAKERYEVEWWVLTQDAKARRAREQVEPGYLYEHDRDRDEQAYHEVFLDIGKARAYAREIVASGETVYGHVTVTKQRLERVEDTTLWEWENVGEPEYID